MKIKHNYLLQFAIVFSILMIGIIPMVGIIMALADFESFKDLISNPVNFLLPVLSIIACSLVCLAVNFLINLFSKKSVLVGQDGFESEDVFYRFDKVSSIYYDLGNLSKHHTTPDSLIISMENGDEITINRPSFKLILILRKNCENSTFKTNVFKKFVFYLSILVGVALLVGILARLGVITEE